MLIVKKTHKKAILHSSQLSPIISYENTVHQTSEGCSHMERHWVDKININPITNSINFQFKNLKRHPKKTFTITQKFLSTLVIGWSGIKWVILRKSWKLKSLRLHWWFKMTQDFSVEKFEWYIFALEERLNRRFLHLSI